MNILREFQKHLEENGKSENTIKSYLAQVKVYVKYLQINTEELNRLNRENIKDYISYLRIRGMKAKTLNNKLSSLLELNRFLLEKGFQNDIVIKKSDFIKIHESYASPNIVDESEITTFRNMILQRPRPRLSKKYRFDNKCNDKINEDSFYIFKNKRDSCIITILAYAGLRISECLNLLITDVAYKDKNGKLILSSHITVNSGKGSKFRRVPMSYRIKNALEEYLEARRKDSHFLFYSRENEKLDRTTINKIFTDYGKGITPHTLRHFAISNMLNNGNFSIQEVQSISGHSDVKTLMIYTHPSEKAMLEKMNKL